MKIQNCKKLLKTYVGITIVKKHTKFHWAMKIFNIGKKTMFYKKKRQKSVKNKNFEKSLQTSRGIAITKQHTKFH